MKSQEAVSCPAGTSISVKNLFFNIPARRNFLKSNSVEARHIIEEFERVALAHPGIALSLNQNGLQVFRLPVSNLRQRIVNLFGSNYNERLVPVSEDTTLLGIGGFVGKPEFARKTRGEQFLYVNKRFVKDAYLHHAVTNAFEELLAHDAYPSYWLYIDINPASIDVNIHPTKTEVKFEDERSVYAIVRAAVKRALGQYSVSPALDFERETSFDLPHSMRNQAAQAPGIKVNPDYNPFKIQEKPASPAGWEKVYEGMQQEVEVLLNQNAPLWKDSDKPEDEKLILHELYFQLLNKFIVVPANKGMVLIAMQPAHERILFERYLKQVKESTGAIQQELFPATITLSSGDFQLMKDIEADIRALGFDVSEFGPNTYVINGTPFGIPQTDGKVLLESLLEQYKNNSDELNLDMQLRLVRAMVKNTSVKEGQKLSNEEMAELINDLFACEKPWLDMDGKPTAAILSSNDLTQLLRR